MFNQLKELYLQGKIEEFKEALKDIKSDSNDIKLLKLLKNVLSFKVNERESLLKETQNLEKEFTDSEKLSYIGLIYIILGDLESAKEILKKAIDVIPTSAFAYFRFSTLFLIQNDYEKAKELMLKGLELKEVAEAYQNLGFLYNQIGDKENALNAYLTGWKFKPYRLGIANKSILNLKELNKIDEFVNELENELEKQTEKKEKAKYLAMLALLKYETKEINEALLKLNQAINLDEDNKELRELYIQFMLKEERYYILGKHLVKWVEKYDRVNEHLALADCRIEAGFLEKAKEGLDTLKDRISSEKLKYEMILANYYKENNEYDKAKEILERLHKDYPQYIPVVNQLAHLYNSLGEIDKSLELLESLGKDAPGLLMKKIDTKKDIKIEEIEKLKEFFDKEENIEVKSSMAFSLAEGYEKLKDYKKASNYIKKANELIYDKLNYSIDEFREEVDTLICSYSKEWVQAKQNNIKFDKRPIFIVGMPRSGTTMLEQIFAAHNEVFGAGELPYISKIINLSTNIMKREYPESFLYAPKDIIKQAGAYYIELTKKMYQFEEPIFVDKLPHNFLHSALLLAMFPNSKVIALRRDYRSIALSNYFQNFAAKKGKLGYSFNIEAMGEHLKDYIRIMDYYKQILPSDRYQEFWYEDLVLYPKEKIPEVLKFCELDFTPELLEFYKNKTAVKTASILQVRNPIYTKSTQKWKKYEELLNPLINIVGNNGIYKENQ